MGTADDVLVNGVRLSVAQAGSGPEAVVFSHGAFMTRHMFDAPVDLLRERYRCVAYDHRGQGHSEVDPTVHAIEVATLYDDALELIHALGLAPCHWVGQSVGSFVGMRLAARHPELMRSLVLLSPRIHRNPASFVRRMDVMFAMVTATQSFGPLNRLLRRTLWEHVGMREMVGSTYMADPTRARDRAAFLDDVADRTTAALVPAVRGIVRYPENRADMLAQITAPTLIIAGEDDVSPPDGGVTHAREVHDAIPGSRLMVVPAAGHTLLFEQPELVSQAISDFLAAAQGRPHQRAIDTPL